MALLTFRDFGLAEDPFPFLMGQPVRFKGIGCDDPLAFGCYNPGELILGGPMQDHLPMAMACWHTIRGDGRDIFGSGTAVRPWEGSPDSMGVAITRLRVGFYFMWLMGLKYWCFHDTDLVPYGENLAEFRANIDAIVPEILILQHLTGIRCGWVTQNVFSMDIFCKGAATGAEPIVWAHAFAQFKKMAEVGKLIGARNHVFWGGREGYNLLLVTNMYLEGRNLALFLGMAHHYAESIGYDAQFLIEPKPKEPTVHQYDMCAMVVYGFLCRYDLQRIFKLNIEVNHAQLALLSSTHELVVASSLHMLGGVDANQGTFGLGWDTDEFLSDPVIATEMMWVILKNGGLGQGVINWDAKVRRESFMPEDLVRGHILGMDTIALGLRAAALLIQEGQLNRATTDRYDGWNDYLGKGIIKETMSPREIEAVALSVQPKLGVHISSGHLESAISIVNRALMRCCQNAASEHIEAE